MRALCRARWPCGRARLVVVVTSARRAYALATHQQLWAEGKPLEGLAVLRELIGKAASLEAKTDLHKELLDMLVGLQQYKEGVTVANAILHHGAPCAQTLFQRGECKERLGESPEDDYEDALQCDPRHVGAMRALARRSKRPRDAVALLTRALDVAETADENDAEGMEDGERADIHCERGVAHTRLQQLDDALVDFDRAIALSQQRCAPAYMAKGDVLLMRHDHLRALFNYDNFFEKHAAYYTNINSGKGAGNAVLADLCIKRSACYAGLGDWPMVDASARAALEFASHCAGVDGAAGSKFAALAEYYMGRAAEGMDDNAAALQRYSAAIAGGTGVRSALLQRALLLRSMNREEEAKQDERALAALVGAKKEQ